MSKKITILVVDGEIRNIFQNGTVDIDVEVINTNTIDDSILSNIYDELRDSKEINAKWRE